MNETTQSTDHAGKTVTLIAEAKHPQFEEFGGAEVHIEGRWDSPGIGGKSWMVCEGNPACLVYAVRSGLGGLPTDDLVWYGKLGSLGVLIHESEIAAEATPDA